MKEDRRREIEEKTKAQDDSNYVKRRTQGGQSGSFGRTSENGREEGQVPKPPFEESRGREVKEEGEREEVPTREDAVPEELRQEVDDESLREVVPLPSSGGFPEGRGDEEEEEEEEEEERSVHVYTGEEEGKKLLNGLKGTEEEEEGEGAQNKVNFTYTYTSHKHVRSCKGKVCKYTPESGYQCHTACKNSLSSVQN